MKLLVPTLLAFALLGVPAAHAVPKGNAYGYWEHGPGSRIDPSGSRVEPSVPEPSGILAFGVGLITVYGAARRRKSA